MQQRVVVYSTPLCGPCEELKAYLRASGISFTVRDVLTDEDAAAELEDRGIWSTPALQVDDEYVEGFDAVRVKALLGLA
ncbi:MAG: glutaredoxin family protein [Dehalococcoidia bacterium]